MDLYQAILKRTNIRKFKDKAIDDELKKKLVDAIKLAPNSSNWHSSSAIIITDKEQLKAIGQANKFARAVESCAMFVVFVADFNRMNLAQKHYPEIKYDLHTTEGFLVAAGDAYIQATMLQDVAISNGLGTCFLGLVRTMIPELRQLLNIKGQAFPVIGLALGYPDEEVSVKPKLNRVFEGKYDIDSLDIEAKRYSKELEDYFTKLAPDKKAYSYYEASILSASRYNMNTKEIEEIWDLKLQNK
ncbi:nitroreductase family protein [Mycoplasma sp. 4044]